MAVTISDPEQVFVDGVKALVAEHPYLKLDLDWGTAIAILGSLQLSLRHPGNSGVSARLVRHFCDEFISRVERADPPLAQLLRMGDDPQYDLPR